MSVFFVSVSSEDASCDEERQRAEKIGQSNDAVRPAIRIEDIGHLPVNAGELAELQQIDSRDEPDPARRVRKRERALNGDLLIVNHRSWDEADI